TGPPVILSQPTNLTVFAGDTYTFRVVGGGSPPLSYQWYKNNSLIGGATSSNYSATAVYPGDNGALFNVVVSNGSGSATSSNAVLTVSNSAPIILTQPQNQAVAAPATATFSVSAAGNKPLSCQWYKNGSMIPGATSSSYTTPPTGLCDASAVFYVMVYNAVGS